MVVVLKNQINFSLSVQFSSLQLLSRVRLFATPWIIAHQTSLSITNSWSSPKLMSIESVMPSSHLILCRPLLLLPPTPPSIRVFSNESALCLRWPKYWSFSFSIIPSKVVKLLSTFFNHVRFGFILWNCQRFVISPIHTMVGCLFSKGVWDLN